MSISHHHLVELGHAVAAIDHAGPGLFEDVRNRHQLSAGSAKRQCLGMDLLHGNRSVDRAINTQLRQ